MENKFTHICIKCKTSYTSNDEDAYLCETCLVEKEAIAKTIDKTHSTVGQIPSGIYTEMEQIAREKGGYFEDGKGNSRVFVNVRDLGLL